MKQITNKKKELSMNGKGKSQKTASLQKNRRGYSVVVRNIYFTGGFTNTGIANWSTCPQCMQ